MSLLTEDAIRDKLPSISGWRIENKQLVRQYEFADFRAAISFVNQVAAKAEAAGHHPDIDIRYNQVRLALVSHDAGGITDRDLHLAKVLNSISAK